MNNKWDTSEILFGVFISAVLAMAVGLVVLVYVSQSNEAACVKAAIEGKYEASEIVVVCSRR